MIAIIDHGSGNVGNIGRALAFLNRESIVLDRPPITSGPVPDALILPGVGAFGPSMSRIISSGWNDFLYQWVNENRPVIGICLGMQLLCESSEEGGVKAGLGIFKGKVSKLKGLRKLPHVGWNTVELTGGTSGAGYFYFVHSYALPPCPDTIAVTSVDKAVFTSIAQKGRTIGFQFHPERSGPAGLKLLAGSFKELGV